MPQLVQGRGATEGFLLRGGDAWAGAPKKERPEARAAEMPGGRAMPAREELSSSGENEARTVNKKKAT